MSADTLARALALAALPKNASAAQINALSGFAGALALNGVVKNANRILRAAAKGISPITTALGSSPTFTQGTTNAASTINGSNAVASTTTSFATGRYSPADTAFVEQIAGPLAYNGSSGYLGDTVINVLATPTRQGGHGIGIRFASMTAVLELGMQNSGGGLVVYVTDASGLRSRVQAADYTTTSGLAYFKWVFGAAGYRIWEVYPVGFTRLTNIVVPATDSIWLAPSADIPKIGLIGDSWGNGSTLGGATNQIKLSIVDYWGETLGVPNVISASVSSTGLLGGSNVATSGTYRQRIAAGDMSVARVGNLDALTIGGSLNDQASSDAARQEEYRLTILAAMAAQPLAFIFGEGPQYTTSTATSAATYAAHKAGFLAAANGDPRCMYIDNGPAGENWLFAGNVAAYIAGDNNHPNDAGSAYYGRRRGMSQLAAIKATYGL